MGLRKILQNFIFGKNLTKNLEQKLNQINNTIPTISGLDVEQIFLFDFKNYASQYNTGFGNQVVIGNGINPGHGNEDSDNSPDTDNKKYVKLKVKPIDVLNQLETIPTPFDLMLLDEKIEILKEKEKLIIQHYSKREINALIIRLENRKKYSEYKEFFEKFQNTTDEKIDILLDKYELVMKTSDIFIPEFPTEAIKIMTEYTEKTIAITTKKPVFYVIAENSKFQKAYKQRDPILLAQSPFGFYWQILGAWDKEMLILSEL